MTVMSTLVSLGQEAYHILPFMDMNREKHRRNYPLNPVI